MMYHCGLDCNDVSLCCVSTHKKLSLRIICSADVCWLCLSSCAALGSHSHSEMGPLCAAQGSVLEGACHLLYSSLTIYRCLGRSLKWQAGRFTKIAGRHGLGLWLPKTMLQGIRRNTAEFSKRRQATPENSHSQVFALKTLETFEKGFHPEMHHKVFLVHPHPQPS